MDINKKFNEIRHSKSGTEKIRVLAFGSSNTERFLPGMHWFDCFDLGIHCKFGRIHHCINSGIGGETGIDLLKRFDTDAALYKPDMVFLTIGGNDSNPDNNISGSQFKSNLYELYKKFNAIGCYVVFQTYYAPIPEELSRTHYSAFLSFMDIVRNTAIETGSGLIDHLKLWLPLQQQNPDKHRELMRDAFHVNNLGNIVLGLYIARHFKCKLEDPFYNQAESYFEVIDKYSPE